MNKNGPSFLFRSFIWGLAIIFYFYEFFLRVLPATLTSRIISSFDISVEQFALIGSAYYIPYALMQIPVGLLLDRFSARILVTIACGLCGLGTLWFGYGEGFYAGFISRLLIGLGSSFGFVSLLIVTLNWFPKNQFAFLAGCGQALGAIGPLVAGGPIAFALEKLEGNWRPIFHWSAIFGLILTVLIALFFKDKPLKEKKIIFVDIQDPLLKRIKQLLRRAQVWLTLLYAGTIYVSLPLLGAFWGTAYLEARGFGKSSAALIISMIWVGLAVGSPIFGKLSDVIKRRKPIAATCALIGVIAGFGVLYLPTSNEVFLASLFFLVGIGGAGQSLSFAIMAEFSPKSLRATAVGLNNTAIMGFAALIPILVTGIMKRFAVDGKLIQVSFEKGLLIIPLSFIIAFLITVLGMRETFCRSQSTIHKVKV